jgi:putative DNA primase/helicase
VAIVSVTHLSKSGGTKAVYRAMGSLAFAAAARAVWAVTKDPDDPQRRLFLPAKLNLACDPDGLAYRIDDGRVVWEYEPVKLHADDAFAAEARAAKGPDHRGVERREATAWLNNQLADGPVPTSQIIADAKENGFAERTLRRAFKEMGGRSRKGSDGQWSWSLPGQDGQQDGQPPP